MQYKEKQFKVEIEKMRLVEQPDPNMSALNGLSGANIGKLEYDEVNEDLEIVPYTSYPILASDLQYWQPLDGKIVGEGEFEVTQKASEENGKPIHYFYAIPIQPKEQGDYIFTLSIPGATALNVLQQDKPQPAIPASDEDWADTEIEFQKTKPDWRKYSRELYMEYYIEFIHANYHPPKRKQ